MKTGITLSFALLALYLNTMIVEVKDVHKSFEGLHVLKGVDLSVGEGEIVSIVGSSGAGKSTLLHLIGTLDKADSGVIKVKDTDLAKLNGNKLADFRNKHIGFIFQFHHLLPEFNAFENVAIPAFIAKTKESDARRRAKELLELLGLSDRLDHKPGELSGGELQRVAVARALINSPAVVLADEPTGNLDSDNSKSLYELFARVREELNQTFIIVTHDKVLSAMTDKQYEIRDGRMVNN